MNTKNCLLLSGALACLLPLPAMATRSTEGVSPNPGTFPEKVTRSVVSVDTLADLAPVLANTSEQAEAEVTEANFLDYPMAQVTPVWQLRDIQPTDWSFQALQSLVKRYGVIVGYPDGTFQGDRPLTRYEFAAALNSVLDAIDQLIESGSETIPTQEDLATLERLGTEFSAELAETQRQIESLEVRTKTLEQKQFSPKVKLGGQVILGVSTAAGGEPPGRGEIETVLSHLTLIQLSSSLVDPKRDKLQVGFVAGNFDDRGFANPQALNTNMTLLSYQADTDNQFELSSLEYRFAVSDRLVFTFKPVGFSLNSVLNSNSPYQSARDGALSRFAGASPIFKIGSLDAGGGLDFLLTNRARLQVAYGVRNGNSSDGGLFSADHRALGVQLLATPANNLRTGIAYVNAFARNGRLDTFTGSNNADISGGFNEPATIHAVNGTLAWRVTPKITLGAWGGVTLTDSLPSDALVLSTTYLFSLGISDLFGRKGDLLAVMVGQPPRLRAGLNIVRADEGSSMHYEAFYRFRVSNRVSITPGFFIVTDPGHISENNNIFVGSIRTGFSF
ncbi:iron uptake porin [Moorena sp. SIO1F2]|uniref:iron uptake porin n=1 Tax=Moorena sp. SIO1F2 TaxID=2607819 RepID=UPI0025E11F88|nr:iron uptake porin [Moorena sp. SIO1F2]